MLTVNRRCSSSHGQLATAGRDNGLPAKCFSRIISRFGDIPWPPRFLDLPSPDIFPFGHLKERVFRTRTQSTQELRNRTGQEIEEFNRTPDLLQCVMNNFRQRLQQTVRRPGEHFIGLVFKKVIIEKIALFRRCFCTLFSLTVKQTS
jgi:hypothetical protein